MEYNSINDFKSNFAKIYHENVVPSLHTFENDRIKTFKSAILYTVIVFNFYYNDNLWFAF